MMRRCEMMLKGPTLTPMLFTLLLVVLFAAAAEAQVGQQPNRNRRPPATAPPSSNVPGEVPGAGQSADPNSLRASYPGANATLERAFIAMNLGKPESAPFHQLGLFHSEVAGGGGDGALFSKQQARREHESARHCANLL